MNEKANRGNGKWIFTKFYTISHVCWGGSDIILLFTIIAEKNVVSIPYKISVEFTNKPIRCRAYMTGRLFISILLSLLGFSHCTGNIPRLLSQHTYCTINTGNAK